MNTVSTVSASGPGGAVNGSSGPTSPSAVGTANQSQSADGFAAILLAMQAGLYPGQTVGQSAAKGIPLSPSVTKLKSAKPVTTAQGLGLGAGLPHASLAKRGLPASDKLPGSVTALAKSAFAVKDLAGKGVEMKGAKAGQGSKFIDVKDIMSGQTRKVPNEVPQGVADKMIPHNGSSILGKMHDVSLQPKQGSLSTAVAAVNKAATSSPMARGTVTNASKVLFAGHDKNNASGQQQSAPANDRLNQGFMVNNIHLPSQSATLQSSESTQSAARPGAVTYGDLQSLYGVTHAVASVSPTGNHEVKVQVHPAGLGTIVVSVQQTPNGMTIGLQSNQMQVSQWLSQNSEALQSRLNQNGLVVSEVAVSFGDTTLQSGQDGSSDRRQRNPDMTLRTNRIRTSIAGIDDAAGATAALPRLGWQGASYGGWV